MQNKPKIKSEPDHTSHWPLNILAAAIIACTIILAFSVSYTVSHAENAIPSEPVIPHGASLASWNENGQNGRYLLRIINGVSPQPGATVAGIVVSDTHCKPDVQGLSHCHNTIDLAQDTHITVMTTHLMSRNPCLKPGESVTLTRVNASWVMATLIKKKAAGY
ncbi:MAG: hypothetical protein KGQ58_09020 [Proteobacteria bacterium]|nr:hypothetical protein [Pseudomonadota bacterium]